MRAKDHLHDLLTGMRSELRRLRRVVRAAERTADAYESGHIQLVPTLLAKQSAAVAAYRKGKKS